MFRFFGQIVGKAIFDGVLLKCTFAKTFLNRLVRKNNTLDDLKTIDKQVYDNLMYLKYYEGDSEDLCLYMCYTDNNFGADDTFDLVPGGSEIPVTNENKMQYIMMYANFILNKKDSDQVKAFTQGLSDVIDTDILNMFFPDEVQHLISGG
jgi:ubiquitin-protein ligase E3 C